MSPHHLKPALYGIGWAASIAIAYHLGTGEPHGEETKGNTPTVSRSDTSTRFAPIAPRNTGAGTDSGNNPDAPSPAGKRPFHPEEEFLTIQDMPPGPERNQAMESLIAKWAQQDGPAALAAAATITEPLLRYSLREKALTSWASADPEAAWTHALTNPNGDLPEGRIQNVIAGLGKADIATALTFLQKHANGDLMPYMGEATATFDQLYQRGGHDLMVPWVQALPAGKMKDGATNRIIDQWARYEPAAAAQWMNSMLAQNPKNTVDARIELTESWARVNPQQALGYVQNLPTDQRQNSYYEVIYKRWLDYDQKAAAAFLADQPTSPALDRPIERYTFDVMKQNPAATMPWAESITDPNRRWKAIERVADVWRKQDPNGLNSYIAGAGYLNYDQKVKLLQAVKK